MCKPCTVAMLPKGIKLRVLAGANDRIRTQSPALMSLIH